MSRDDATVLDMLLAARRALEFTQGLDRAAFMNDPKSQAAVLYEVTILGEAAKRVSSQFRECHPEIPWRDIFGMRDRLVHQYDQISLGRVWEVVTGEVPALAEVLAKLVPARPEHGPAGTAPYPTQGGVC